MTRIAMTAMIALAAALSAASAQTSSSSSKQGSPMTPVSPDVLQDLAPTGKLRAAINLGNMVLAQKDPATGRPKGVTADLARELGRRLLFRSSSCRSMRPARCSRRSSPATSMSCSSRSSRCAPTRSTSRHPTSSSRASTWCRRIRSSRRVDEVDRAGVRIGVSKNSAYDLYPHAHPQARHPGAQRRRHRRSS